MFITVDLRFVAECRAASTGRSWWTC